MHILLSSGGTGGHVFPALALGEALQKDGHIITYVTDQRGKRFFKNTPHFTTPIYRHHFILKSLIYPFSIGLQTLRCIFMMSKNRPDICIGFGGYPSLPAMIAGKFMGAKLVLHEQNAVFGQANRFLVKWAKIVALSFEKTERVPSFVDTLYTGNFVRTNIQNLAQTPLPEGSTFNIFIVGGSQGSALFSKILPEVFFKIPQKVRQKIRLVQQCRQEDLIQLDKTYKKFGLSFELKPFFDNMPKRYTDCHLVIARSGASTVAEVLTIGRPAIYIPLKISKESDQTKNATFCVEKNLAWCVDEGDTKKLGQLVCELIEDKLKLEKMKTHLNLFSYPDGITQMRHLIESI